MHVKKHPPPFPPRFETSESIWTKKGHFAENFSFAFDIFEAFLIFERPTSRVRRRATSWRRTLQMKIPETISDPSKQILFATKNRRPRWPSPLNFHNWDKQNFTLCVHGTTKEFVITRKKRVSCQASCFQNPPILLQQNDNWKEKFLSIYFPLSTTIFTHIKHFMSKFFLQRKITSSLPCKDTPPHFSKPQIHPPWWHKNI